MNEDLQDLQEKRLRDIQTQLDDAQREWEWNEPSYEPNLGIITQNLHGALQDILSYLQDFEANKP